MLVSVIVPARNAAETLGASLDALKASTWQDFELIVVNDASADNTAEIARGHGAQVVQMQTRVGPATARNRGADIARGEILLFVDADVCVHDDALERIAAHFGFHGTRVFARSTVDLESAGDGAPARVDAVFGSYDDSPPAEGFFSRYKNLSHHFVHQSGTLQASTFWAGCGAVRKEVFVKVSGFDESYREPSIEDIELGYRLSDAGHRILLDPRVQATHLKRWTLGSMVATDILRRAIPWLRLLRERRTLSATLNIDRTQRACVLILYTALLCVLLAFAFPAKVETFLGAAVLAVLVVLGLNRRFYTFLGRNQGISLALRAAPVHLVYFLYCGAAALWVQVCTSSRRR